MKFLSNLKHIYSFHYLLISKIAYVSLKPYFHKKVSYESY